MFCDCGVGLRVPWESSAIAPTPPELPEEEPIRFEPTQGDAPRAKTPDIGKVKLRRRPHAPIDADYCFNHTSSRKESPCDGCGLSFCKRCLAKFEGKSLCAACKNYRTRLLQRKPQTPRFATASFVTALFAGPALFLMAPYMMGTQSRWLTLLLLLPQAFALAAGIHALLAIRRDPSRGGGHLAVAGVGLASLACVLMLLATVFASKIWV